MWKTLNRFIYFFINRNKYKATNSGKVSAFLQLIEERREKAVRGEELFCQRTEIKNLSIGPTLNNRFKNVIVSCIKIHGNIRSYTNLFLMGNVNVGESRKECYVKAIKSEIQYGQQETILKYNREL